MISLTPLHSTHKSGNQTLGDLQSTAVSQSATHSSLSIDFSGKAGKPKKERKRTNLTLALFGHAKVVNRRIFYQIKKKNRVGQIALRLEVISGDIGSGWNEKFRLFIYEY